MVKEGSEVGGGRKMEKYEGKKWRKVHIQKQSKEEGDTCTCT